MASHMLEEELTTMSLEIAPDKALITKPKMLGLANNSNADTYLEFLYEADVY
jgi:hypothetical protein